MTKYIKDKNGKFAGSIGDGKTAVPTTPPTPPMPTTAAKFDLTEIPAPPVITKTPDYCLEAHLTPNTTLSTLDVLPGRPSLDERSSWTAIRAQADMEDEFLHGETGLFTALSKPPQSLAYFAEMESVHAHASTRAGELRSEGKHHQAAAAEWTALTANRISRDFYDIYEDSSWTHDNEGSEFGAGENPTLLFRDTTSQYAVVASYDGTVSEDLEWNESQGADWIIPMDVMRQDAREMFTGAIIMDYLSLSGGDVEAAAVWGSIAN